MTTTTEIREHIASEVRAELARQQITQRDLAAVLGMTQPALQLRLVGKRSFRGEELAKIATHLGVPATRFLPTEERVR